MTSFALPPGTRLQGGALLIEDTLGRVPFGIAYQAIDTQLNRPVVLKEFFPGGMSRCQDGITVSPTRVFSSTKFADQRAIFHRGRQLRAQLHHPGLIPIHSVFEENGTTYLVMDLLEGENLGAYVEDRISSNCPLPWDEAVTLICSLEEVLTYLHSEGVLHQDIQPANLFRRSDGTAVLMDFGLAHGYQADPVPPIISLETPGFAAPELWQKRMRRGPFTDVYALAATLYYLVTGEFPTPALLRLPEDLMPTPHALVPTTPLWLSDAIQSGMALIATDRPASISEFCSLLTAPLLGSRLTWITHSLLTRLSSAAMEIQSNRNKVSALTALGAILARTNRTQARGLLEEALPLAERIANSTLTALALTEIADSWIKIDTKKARQILTHAQGVATLLWDAPKRTLVLGTIALTLSKIDLQEALQVANTIPHTFGTACVLSELAAIWGVTDRSQAIFLLEKARQAAEIIEDPEDQAFALGQIATSWIPLDLPQAQQITETISVASVAAEALCRIAGAWIKTDPLQARQILEKAYLATKMITEAPSQIRILSEIAVVWNQLDPEKAPLILEVAFTLAEIIEYSQDKVAALRDITRGWMVLDTHKAREILEVALTAGHSTATVLTDEPDQAFALSPLAEIWVQIDAEEVWAYAMQQPDLIHDSLIVGMARGIAQAVADDEVID